MANRHDWNSWDHYLQIHSNRISDYDYFIPLDDLHYTLNGKIVIFQGSLYCLSGLRIDVEKRLRIEMRGGRPFVKTYYYKYHVLLASTGRNLMRYDNVHAHQDHPDEHHMHLYDLPAGHPQELNGRVLHVGEDGWPTLADFIDEVIARFHSGGSERAEEMTAE